MWCYNKTTLNMFVSQKSYSRKYYFLEHLQGFCIIDLAFVVVCKLSKQNAKSKNRPSLRVLHNWLDIYPKWIWMQIFSCVARSTFLRAQVPASPVVSPPTLLSVGRDRLLTAACGGSFYAMVLLAIGSGWRRVGREFRRSQSAADSDAWRASARDGVPRNFDRLRTAARGGPRGFCRNRLNIYGAKKSPDHVGD